jgi:cleavage and polyadenylation specificity factor subunit 1
VLIGGHRPQFLFGERDSHRFQALVLDEDRYDVDKTHFDDAHRLLRDRKQNTPKQRRRAMRAAIACATPFHSASSSNAFVSFDMNGLLQIATLPADAPFSQRESSVQQLAAHNQALYIYHERKAAQEEQQKQKALAKQAKIDKARAELNKKKEGNEAKEEAEESDEDEEEQDQEVLVKPSANIDLRIAATRRFTSYDVSDAMSATFLPLRSTIHYISRHGPTQTYVIVSSKPVKMHSMEMETARSLPVFGVRFEVLFFNSDTWEPVGRYDAFEEHEQVTCVRCVRLADGDSYIAIGTARELSNEDSIVRGRITLLKVFYAMGVTHAEGKVQMLKIQPFKRDEHNPVTALSVLDGLLVVAIGQRILCFQFVCASGSFIGKAFFDTNLYVVSLHCVKRYIIFGDVYKSLVLLVWDPVIQQIALLSSDYNKLIVYASNVMIDGASFNMAVADSNKNVQLFRYLPHLPESFMGKRLLPRADFHVGSCVQQMVPLSCRRLVRSVKKKQKEYAAPFRTMLLNASLDGAYSLLAPISERVYKRLNGVHGQLVYALSQHGGCNPRAHRLFHSPSSKKHMKCEKRILDIQLVNRFLSMDVYQQRRLARSLGTTPEQILDNMLLLERVTRLY